jgi:hypothetical protein
LAARGAGDESAQRTRRFWPEGVPTDQPLPIRGRATRSHPREDRQHGGFGSQRQYAEPTPPPAINYEQLVRQAVRGNLSVSGVHANFNGGVYNNISGDGVHCQ